MPFRATDRMTIAKPVHIQVMTMIRAIVLIAAVSTVIHGTGSTPTADSAPLTVPTWGVPGGL